MPPENEPSPQPSQPHPPVGPYEPTPPAEPTQPQPEASTPSSSIHASRHFKPGSDVVRPGGPFVSGATGAPGKLKSGRRRRLLVLVGLFVVLLGGGASAYFFLILPGTPDGLWSKALNNTAIGYDRLITYIDEKEETKGFRATGTLEMSGEASGDGSFEVIASQTGTSAKLDFGSSGVRLKGEMRFLPAANASAPDMYFKVDGLRALDALIGEAEAGMVNNYFGQLDGKWIFVDHTLFSGLEASQGVETDKVGQLTQADYVAMARAIGEVNRDYLLTTRSDRNVLTIAEKVGDEDKDGHATYHYKVGYNKEHLKAYVTALKDKLKETKFKDTVEGEDVETVLGFHKIISSIDRMDGQGKADVWVDKNQKMIRAVRFTEKDQAETYTEFALNYEGGDEFPFIITGHDKSTDAPLAFKLTTTLNTRTNEIKMDLAADLGPDSELTANVQMSGHNEDLKLEVPADPLPVTEVLAPFMPLFQGGGGEETPTIFQSVMRGASRFKLQ